MGSSSSSTYTGSGMDAMAVNFMRVGGGAYGVDRIKGKNAVSGWSTTTGQTTTDGAPVSTHVLGDRHRYLDSRTQSMRTEDAAREETFCIHAGTNVRLTTRRGN